MSVIIDLVDRRINKQNKNWLAIITGETGSGKSYCALKIGEMIDPEFNIERVVFTPEDFMKLLNSGTLKRGSVIIWDEAGVGIPAREWYSLSNKVISYTLQTFRRENLGVIFTTPSFDFIDSQARKLFHAYIETLSINREDKYVITKFMNVQNNPRSGEIYMKYPRIKVNGRIKTFDRLCLYKPSKQLLKPYEKKKKEFSNKLKVDTESIINGIKEKEKEKLKTHSLEDIVKKVIENIDYYSTTKKGRTFIDRPLVMAEFKIGRQQVSKVVSVIESKERKKKDYT